MKKLILFFPILLLIGSASPAAYCSNCKAVDCRMSYQCGYRCECVKLNNNYEGQCVEK